MTTVIVTGGAGYIGSHTCKRLAAQGFTPVTVDNLSRGHRDAVRFGPLVEADIGDRDALGQVFSTWKPAAVLHIAGFAYVGESVSDPGLYYDNNTARTLVLLEAMRAHGIGRLVFSSSCATYGIPEDNPIHEGTPQRPINPYGESKLMVEQMLRAFDAAYGVRFAALRYFNAAGSDPETEIGWFHDPETRLIPRVLMAAAGKIPYLEMFGEDFPTPDGTCIRDYIHVCDLADAHILALRHLLNDGSSQYLNLGIGRGYSVKEVIRAVEAVTGLSVPVKVGPRRPGDPAVLIADAGQAREILGFSPSFVDLRALIGHAWAWYRREGRGSEHGA